MTLQDAERWARSIEIEIDRGTFVSCSEVHRKTLCNLIERYMNEVTPCMKGASDELIRLASLRRNPICRINVAALTPVSLGMDTFEGDPISGFTIKTDDYLRIGERLKEAGLPTVLVFEGGYAVDEVGINAANVLQAFDRQRGERASASQAF